MTKHRSDFTSRGTERRHKVLKVRFEDDYISITIPIKIRSNDLTIGWLFSEVGRQYNRYIETVNEAGFQVAKRLMVALKSEEAIPTLDYLLTDMSQ